LSSFAARGAPRDLDPAPPSGRIVLGKKQAPAARLRGFAGKPLYLPRDLLISCPQPVSYKQLHRCYIGFAAPAGILQLVTALNWTRLGADPLQPSTETFRLLLVGAPWKLPCNQLSVVVPLALALSLSLSLSRSLARSLALSHKTTRRLREEAAGL
jgi:hypothetical protein